MECGDCEQSERKTDGKIAKSDCKRERGDGDGLAIEPAEQDRAQRSAAGGRERDKEKSAEVSACAQTVGRGKMAVKGQQRDFGARLGAGWASGAGGRWMEPGEDATQREKEWTDLALILASATAAP